MDWVRNFTLPSRSAVGLAWRSRPTLGFDSGTTDLSVGGSEMSPWECAAGLNISDPARAIQRSDERDGNIAGLSYSSPSCGRRVRARPPGNAALGNFGN